MIEPPLLELKHLNLVKPSPIGPLALVQDLSLRLDRGQSLGLLGASGSGKSLTALAILRLLPWPAIQVQSGRILFRGENLLDMAESELNGWRGNRVAAIFQDALAALNPVRRIESQLDEVFRFHQRAESSLERRDRMQHCLGSAGLPDPQRILRAFPHELSGGMRQRVLLAMALLLKPELLIADEPTSALDVTLQTRWIEQMHRLRSHDALSLLFISHDFALVLELCDQVMIIYRGRVMESGPAIELLEDPWHPYTQALIAALPRAGRAARAAPQNFAESELASGCPYAASCPQVMTVCRRDRPPLQAQGARQVACHLLDGKADDHANP